jgi:hypothetical protein
MKKIIISNKQLDEAMTIVPKTNNPADIANMVNTGDTMKQQTIVNPNSNINSPVSKKNISITKDSTGKYNPNDIKAGMEKLGKEQGSLTFVPTSDTGISTTNTLMEKTYSKKHIEEVRKFNGRVMTKRELMESWGVAGNGTINDVYEIINNKKNEYQNKFQKAIGSLTQLEEEIKNAINDIKSNLEDLGINVTGMEVECNDDDFEIFVKTDWVLKGDDYDENEEDYRKYKYLASVTGAEFSYYRAQQGYKTHYANQYSYVHFGLEDDKNPYFKIWGDIPDMNVEDNERY